MYASEHKSIIAGTDDKGDCTASIFEIIAVVRSAMSTVAEICETFLIERPTAHTILSTPVKYISHNG